MSVGDWAAVCAEATEPALVEAVVARLAGGRGSGGRIARDAADLAIREGFTGRALLAGLAPPPGRTAREGVRPIADAWRRLGVQVALACDPHYPRRLARWWPSGGAPVLLAWRGSPVPDRPSVAIVGARRASTYGSSVAAWLGEALAEAGCHIVSGGAVGVDAAGHGGALAGSGPTTAVLGCGHDVTYPRPHAAPGGLFDRILDAGGTIASELLPHERPHRGNVLARNRIVAGACDVVVVVEGGSSSGSLRTAGIAADLGVPVLAVPGDIRAPGSAAPHRLLGEGAAPCTGPEDVLTMLGTARGVDQAPVQQPAPSVLPGPIRDELVRRWPRPVRGDDLAGAVGMGIGAVLAAVTRGRIAGEVAESPEGIVLRRRP